MIDMFNNLTLPEFIIVVNSLRYKGRTWRELDDLFGVSKGRTRRSYKSACNSLGFRDIHYYRHAQSY